MGRTQNAQGVLKNSSDALWISKKAAWLLYRRKLAAYFQAYKPGFGPAAICFPTAKVVAILLAGKAV